MWKPIVINGKGGLTKMNSKLYRSGDNRMIAGVAGGLAEYFKIDVSLVRLIWIMMFVWGGWGLIAYLVAWIVIPERRTNAGSSGPEVISPTGPPQSQAKTDGGNGSQASESNGFPTLGIVLIGLGLFLLIKNIFPWPWVKYSWPILLIVIGIWLLVNPQKNHR
jgi:phage shock protein PspC (stress-responsive transcriptional regulator)